MSSEKRRLKLCPRPFSFPQYDVIGSDLMGNETLQRLNQPSDTVVISDQNWDKGNLPDDAVSKPEQTFGSEFMMKFPLF